MPSDTKPAATTDDTTTKDGQGDLPGTGGQVDWKARAEAAQAELAKQNDTKRKADADAKKKADAAAAKKAEEDGKLKEELEKANAEKTRLAEEKEAMETALRERVDRNLAKLPKEVQEEIGEVREHLPLAKLDALIEKRLGATTTTTKPDDKKPTGKAPPPAGIKGADSTGMAGHQIHAETKETLQQLYVKPRTMKMTEELGVDSAGKFGWGRTDDQNKNTANFIDLMNRIKFIPVGAPSEDAVYDRVLKK